MNIQSIELSGPLHLGPLRIADEKEKDASFFTEEEKEMEKKNLPSPMMLASSKTKKSPTINSPEQLEKFLLQVFNKVRELSELRADHHQEALLDNHERREALNKELHELGVQIEKNGTISFYLGYVTTGASIVTAGATLISLYTGGTALVIAGASAFVGAWTKAAQSYFDINKEQFESDALSVRMNIDVASEDSHRHTEVISGNLEEITRLMENHFQAIQEQHNIRKKTASFSSR